MEKDRLIEFAKQHAAELARIAELAGALELRERLLSLPAVWTGGHWNPILQGSSGLDIEICETIGGFLDGNEAIQAPWFYCLREACYAMAADYALQRYLMSDYYRIRFDYAAYYELWIGGGRLFFDDGQCLVSPVNRR